MYVILCYDVGSKRIQRVRKTTKKYLHAVQKSVFEGNITEGTLRKLKTELERLIEPEHDAVTIYDCAAGSVFSKEQLGLVNDSDFSFL